jgi:DNA-binding transcriptional MocR family regulator
MLDAIDEFLVPTGMRISTGKPYTETSEETNGTSNGHKEVPAQAGGYFIWLLLPDNLAGKGAALAAMGLEKYDLKFAYGDMMQVQGDATSADRAGKSYGNGVRLSWAWHTEEEIVEGIKRLAALVEKVQDTKQA